MAFILWLIAVILVIVGVVKLVQRQWLLGAVLIALGFLIGPGGVSLFGATVAYADDGSSLGDPQGMIVPDDTLASIRLSVLAVQALIATLIPVITGFVTKYLSRLKGVVTLVLNAVGALIVQSQLADGSAVISQQSAIVALLGLVQSVAVYLAIWKPLGVTSSDRLVKSGDGKIVAVPGRLAGGGVV